MTTTTPVDGLGQVMTRAADTGADWWRSLDSHVQRKHVRPAMAAVKDMLAAGRAEAAEARRLIAELRAELDEVRKTLDVERRLAALEHAEAERGVAPVGSVRRLVG